MSWAGCANFGTGRDITKARAKAFILGSHFYSHKIDCVSQSRYFSLTPFRAGSLLLEIGDPDSLPPASTSHAHV